ncbi:MAG: CPBP family intramembrane metalloprotease, partial [Planctomycetes bacterium]|nr:CPBP family intramembrane metalloprotease [Planctomycetota bacterium]
SLLVVPLGQWFGVADLRDADDTLALGVNALSYSIATVCAAMASLWIGRRFIGSPSQSFVLGKKRWASDIAMGWCAVFIAFALCQGVLYATQEITMLLDPKHDFPEHRVIDLLTASDRPVWLVPLLWVGTTILTPIAEEFFFRGLLQTSLCRWIKNRWLAIFVASLIFGIAHADQPQVIPAITVFGIILGVTYERTGSLVAPIVAHALFNAKTLLWVTLAAT